MAEYLGPYYPGPYEDPEYGTSVPFPNSQTCPLIFATRKEGISYGPGYNPNFTSEGGNYTSTCSGSWRYVLYFIETTVSTYYATNESICPGSWGNQQGISTRVPISDGAGTSIDIYGNSELGAVYYEYLDCEEQPDGGWNYTRNTYKTTMRFVVVPADADVCPPGTIYNPETGTCDVLPDYYWDPTTQTYLPTNCLIVQGDDTICEKGTYTYTIKYHNRDTLELVPVEEDTIVYLSYPGGNIKNNLHFTAPSSVTIPAGEATIDFSLVLYIEIDGNFNIVMDSVLLPCNSSFPVLRVCEEGTGNTGTDGLSCCNSSSKAYLSWMDCKSFPEPRYPGNMLKDGTILE